MSTMRYGASGLAGPRSALTNSTFEPEAFHEPTRMVSARGMVYPVISNVMLKPCEGSGPTTAPSVQHDDHFQEAEKLPVAASHACTSLGSSSRTTLGGGVMPTRPTLDMVIERLLPLSGLLLSGVSSVITR